MKQIIPEDQIMDVDQQESSSSTMDQDWQIPKVELSISNNEVSAHKRYDILIEWKLFIAFVYLSNFIA